MKTRISIAMLVLGCLVVMSVYAAEEGAKETAAVATPPVAAAAKKAVSLETDQQKISYIIGTQIARDFQSKEIEVDVAALAMGIKDTLAGAKPALSMQEMQSVYGPWQARMRAKMLAKQKEAQAKQAKEASENLAKSNAFLQANKTKEGVIVLPSGLQYKVIKEGTGKTPVATDKVRAHYRGTLIDGTEFDSSYKRALPGQDPEPVEFPVTGVIKGWIEALQLMKEGGKWELYIPANLAYSTRPRPGSGIPPNAALIFEIELIEIVKPEPPATTEVK